ncbi:pilus assembly protein [Persephonella sp.]
MKRKIAKPFLVILIFLQIPFYSKASEMEQYCSIPPFLGININPNVVLLMDFSGSMQFPAYYDCNFNGYYYPYGPANCGNRDEISATYNNDVNYYGYFESEACYTYDGIHPYWIKSDCNCSGNGGRGNVDCLSGNFLNWLLTSRIDAALKALIGGKAECDENNCILKPQGSRRYVDDSTLHCRYYVRFEDYDNRDIPYNEKHMIFSILDRDGTCELGTFSDRHADVRIEKNDRKGIIQENFDTVRFTFMVYGNYNDREGEIRYSFHQEDLESLISALQNETPYGGTPTGEAMYEVYDYLKQSDDHNFESNSSFIDRGGEVDPYFEKVGDEYIPASCRKSYVVLISDGEWNGDYDPDTPAYNMHIEDIRDDITSDKFPEQKADVYTIFAFTTSSEGLSSMKTVAAYGGFREIEECNDELPYDFLSPDNVDSLNVDYPTRNCDPSGTYNTCCREWDDNRDGIPDNFYQANDGAEIEAALREIFKDIKKGATSGTVIGSQTTQKSRSSIINHAATYPKKEINDYGLSWIGKLFTYWFLNTPYAQNIRDNTKQDGRILLEVYTPSYDSKKENDEPITESDYYDFILSFDTTEDNRIIAYLYESTARGEINTDTDNNPVLAEYSPNPIPTIEETHYLWEGGEILASTDGSERDIYVALGGNEITEFNIENRSSFKDYLGNTSSFPDCIPGETEDDKVKNLIKYIRGEEDFNGCRNRTFVQNSSTYIWKLGDIMHSSPAIVNYNYPFYKGSIVFIGSNDGMLHAFEAGKIKRLLAKYQVAELLTDNIEKGLGKELWAFIPKNVLPYLRYLASPEYCHIYFVDLSPYILYLDKDVTDLRNEPDRIILIGGLRLGGACGCTGDNCINPPSDTCPEPGNNDCVGLSSYFALDITNPKNPQLLWEFTHKDLGFSFSGPGVIRILDGNEQKAKLVFASGPTNYRGVSNQQLRLFVLDAETGSYEIINTGIENAFGGVLQYEGLDLNNDGNTDFLFLGYTEGTSIDSQKGGILAIKTFDGISVTNLTDSIDSNMLPVVTSVQFGNCYEKPYIFFGTGKWFYREDNPQRSEPNKIYGIPLDCSLTGCSVEGSLLNAGETPSTGICSNITPSERAMWYRELDSGSGSYMKEKNLASPSVTNFNAVFFATSQPAADLCGFGGRHRIWHLNCATGAPVTYNCGSGFYITANYTLLYSDTGGRINQERKPEPTGEFVNTGNTGWKKHLVVGGQSPQAAYTPGGEILLWLER